MDYLLSEEDESSQKDITEESDESLFEVTTKTIIVYQKELHVCAKCGKDIPENELVSEDITNRERHGRHTKTFSIGQTYYHKTCLDQVKKDRAEVARRIRVAKTVRAKKLSFGWGIAGGAVALIIALVIFLSHTEDVSIGACIVLSILIGYGVFAAIYCIISGSYIGEVFVWCARLTIKFPGLIFSWDLDGFMWLIAMKILFAVIGFLFGVFALLFAVGLSAVLGAVSFPFVLIHNNENEYEDALTN